MGGADRRAGRGGAPLAGGRRVRTFLRARLRLTCRKADARKNKEHPPPTSAGEGGFPPPREYIYGFL